MLKEKSYKPRILYPEKLPFKGEGEIKTFLAKQKLREFAASRPAMQEVLRGVLLREGK